MESDDSKFMIENNAENVSIKEIKAKDKSKDGLLTKFKKKKYEKTQLPSIEKDLKSSNQKVNLVKQENAFASLSKTMNKTFPNYSDILVNPSLPGFYKNSVKKKTEALVSFTIRDKIDFDGFCNLKSFKDFFDKLSSENKIVKSLDFDSIECLTDAAFYLFYKYFNKNDIWKILDNIKLESCRYITDFGIDLINEASGKDKLIDSEECIGCTNIFDHFYKSEKNDIFHNNNFSYLDLNEPLSDLNTFKILVLNCTNDSFVGLLAKKKIVPKFFNFEFEKISFAHRIFNIFEFDSFFYSQNQRFAINTSSSILVVYFDFDLYKDSVHFIEDLTNKFLDILNQAIDYLKIVLVVKNCAENEVVKKLIDSLKKSVESIGDEEVQFCQSLDKVKFFEQEMFRDKFRLKFKTEKFIQNSSIIKFINLKEDSIDKLLTEINCDLDKRLQTKPFKILDDILAQQTTNKNIIEYEELLDQCFYFTDYDFRSKIQQDYGHLINDFLTFKNFLGDCLLFKLKNGQLVIIADIKWFFNSIKTVINYLQNSKLTKYNSFTNCHLVNMELFGKTEALEHLGLDDRTFKILIELMEYLNILSKTGNIDEFYLNSKFSTGSKERQTKSYEEFWPKNLDSHLNIHSTYEFYFKLSDQVLNDLMSKFYLLPNVLFKDDNSIICQEGSMNLCINYEESKKQIHLMLYSVDLSLLVDEKEFANNLKNINKMIAFMFNEYKIVFEAVLIEKKIPFKFGHKNHTLYDKLVSNINDEFLEIINSEAGNLLVNHKFQRENRNQFVCKTCSVSLNWSKLVHQSYRTLFPIIPSKNNRDSYNFSSILMNPFDFNYFSVRLKNEDLTHESSVICGVLIRHSSNEIDEIFLSSKKRQIQRRTWNTDDHEKLPLLTLIENQRYKQNKKTKFKTKLMENKKDQLNDQDLRKQLLKEIEAFGNDANMLIRKNSETWKVNSGDEIKIQLDSDTFDYKILFYYNNELIGSQIIQDTSSEITSQVSIVNSKLSKSGMIRIISHSNNLKPKSNLANTYKFGRGMLIEIEKEIDQNELAVNDNISKSYITAAIVDSVDEDSGIVKYKILGDNNSESVECTSNRLHPCGFWNFIHQEVQLKKDKSDQVDDYNDLIDFRVFDSSLDKYLVDSVFKWDLFVKKNSGCQIAPIEIFSHEQKEYMPNKYHARSKLDEGFLTCDFTYNPRFVWNSLHTLSSEDLTSIFQNLGIVKQTDEYEENECSVANLSALVLLPLNIDQNFVHTPYIKSIDYMSNLNVSCIHRENVKLFIDNQSFININYPHLLQGEGFNLIKENTKLTLKYITILLCTCLDLKMSQKNTIFPNFNIDQNISEKKFNRSMKKYFDQLTSCICMIIPFFYELQLRMNKSKSLRELIIEESSKYFLAPDSSTTNLRSEAKNSKLENFINEKINEFNLSSNGMCKYCNAFNINLANVGLKEGASLDKFFKKSFKHLKEFSRIITSIRLKDTLDLDASEPRSISLSSKLFKNLPNLVTLNLENLKVSEIDQMINNAEFVKNVELRNNCLSKFPKNILCESKSLTQLIIDNQPLKEIPSSIFILENLKSLVLSRLNLSQLPHEWPDKHHVSISLKSLIISECKLKFIPNQLLDKCPFIEQLTFQGVNLILPENENLWSSMNIDLNKVIDAYCPSLMSLEETRTAFNRFDYDNNMYLDYKELQHFNAFIFSNFPRAMENSLPSLDKFWIVSFKKTITHLDLSFQAIKKIPDAIAEMTSLKVFKLRYCVYLESLSAYLGNLKLNELDLTGCISLKTPPLEIQRKGVNSVLAYLHRLLTGSVECKRTKLMLLGLGGAGKTSLVEAMTKNLFQNDNRPPPNLTDGISILDWKVDIAQDQNLTFSIFDFAGQVVYYNTHQFFLTNRSIYLLVWNVRLGAQHSGLDFWLNSINCHAPLCPIFIVGTHIDQVSKFDLSVEKYKSKYSQIVGFHFVSSFDGNGIPQLTEHIINISLKEKYMGEKIPKCWLEFETNLHELKKEKYLLEYSEAEKIADSHGIFDKNELTQALIFLHDLGSIMYFNNQFLRDKVVINPQFMVDLLACLVSVNNNYIVDGHLHKEDVENIWKKYSSSLHNWILKITEKFDLTFEIADKNLHLVPCLLPEMPPKDINWSEFQINKEHDQQSKTNQKETKIIYNFEYLPIGLFNRAQVRLYLMTDTRAIWKTGSIIYKNKHKALITKRDNIIKVKCIGIQPENLVFLIHEVLESLIAESFNGVTFDFSFPCPDCYDNICINTHTSMFSASLVRQAMRAKAVFIQCRNMFHVIPIADLPTKMPPDSIDSYDVQLKNSVRDLKHLKQKLSNDIAILYSTKDILNEKIIQPRQIKIDLEKNNYTCWFSEAPDQISLDSMSILLKNSSLILFCITDNFCSDQRCVQMFNYVKLNIIKPYVLVVLGESFEWQKTQVGALVTNEFFIKINTISRYQTSLPDLIDYTKRKLELIKNKSAKKNEFYQCFISYCRVNSQDAINKGTPQRDKLSVGWGDPRELKKQLEKAGYSVWIDYEQVGSRRNLFEDIVEGIRNCQLFIACISNEYAQSENCMKEFRFASNLKKPTLLCIYGSAQRNSEWKSTELGIISLNNKEINFQLENKTAIVDVLEEIKKNDIKPVLKETEQKNDILKVESDEFSNQAYKELIELTQRKFLRQVVNFLEDGTSKPFPRLIIIDMPEETFMDYSNPSHDIALQQTSGKKLNLLKSLSSSKRRSDKVHRSPMLERFYLRAACEHESGWHPSGRAIIYENIINIPLSHISYLYRIMSIIKHSDLNLEILKNHEKFQELMVYFDESLTYEQTSAYQSPSVRFSSSTKADNYGPAGFKESYLALKKFILQKFDNLLWESPKQMDTNSNRVNHFELNRCLLPSGKIVWLCDHHSKDEHVHILTSLESENFNKFQNDEFNSILFEQLKTYNQE